MKCPKCNKEIPDGSKFCLECGSAVSSASKQSHASAAEGGAEPSLGDLRTLETPGGAAAAAGGLAGAPLASRYELGAEIGRGGFAAVWKARDRKLDRTVAVKRLLPGAGNDAQARLTLERFRREARVIGGLNHRHIVEVYDHDCDAEGDYIVMEYVDGGTLREYLKSQGGKLPVVEALPLFRGLAQGVAYAHRKNLVHRDLKPANILLELDGGKPVAKIADFGLARQGTDSSASLSGYGMGTPYYMPPEQRRDAKNVNHTADIYALGKVLYEMVSGDVPDNVHPGKIPPPPELARIIFKCVETKPEDRYFSVDDLLRDLDAACPDGMAARSTAALAGANGNACPACGVENGREARFCVGCGRGLFAGCPECGRENPETSRFCPDCGTDVPAFLKVQEVLAKMQQYAQEQKPSRVLKEFEFFAEAKFTPRREKGKALVAAVATLQQQVVEAERKRGEEETRQQQEAATRKAQIERFFKSLNSAVERGDWGKVKRVAEELLPLSSGEQREMVKTWAAKAEAELRLGRELDHALRSLQTRAFEKCIDQTQALVKEFGGDRLINATRLNLTNPPGTLADLLALAQTGLTRVAELHAQLHAAEKARDCKAAQAAVAAIRGIRPWDEVAGAYLRRKNVRYLQMAMAAVAAVLLVIAGLWMLGSWWRLESLKAEFNQRLAAHDLPGAAMVAQRLGEKHPPAVTFLERYRHARDGQGQMEVRRAAAERLHAADHAREWWDKAEAKQREAERFLGKFDLSKAESVFAEGARLYDQAGVSAKKRIEELNVGQNYSQALAAAKIAVLQKKWIEAQFQAGKALAVKPGDPEAAQFLAEALGNLIGRIPAACRAVPRTASVPEPYTGTGWAKEVVHEATGITLVYVPAGSFQMGSPETEAGRYADETLHRVTLTRGFYMGKMEVTQEQWVQVTGMNPAKGKGADLPVENVSWNDCQAFFWKAGNGLRLPTEAEWEYACRAGTTGAFAGDLAQMAWSADNSANVTHPVGRLLPNAWGLYDMHGNVAEWCADLIGPYPKGAVTDPPGPPAGSLRVDRGGGGLNGDGNCRSAYRSDHDPSYSNGFLGFRVVFMLSRE